MTDPSKTPALDDDALQSARERIALQELVGALDATHWSSWQTTAPFDKQLDHARALLASRRLSVSPPVPEGWRTIETAPKEGTILGYDRVGVVVMKFAPAAEGDIESGELPDGSGVWAIISEVGDQLHFTDEITHWMPLPPPPAATQGQEG